MWRVAFWLWATLSLASCAGRVTSGTPTTVEFQSGDDLIAALQSAGVQTSETAKVALPFLGLPGRVWQVGQTEVQIFTFPSVAQREQVSRTIAPDASSVNGQAVDWANRPNIWASGRLMVVYVGTDGGTILLLSGILGDALTQPAGGPGGPYPPAVAAAIAAVAEEGNITPGAVEVVSYEVAQWPDACLGLPDPGEACAQHVTSGWRIELRVNGKTVVMRSDDVGTALRRQAGP